MSIRRVAVRIGVFSRGLHAPSTATVVRLRDRDLLITDGPYVEGKEHIGGFWIIDAPALLHVRDEPIEEGPVRTVTGWPGWRWSAH